MKLEDIKKQNIHKVPDGYFEELPQVIQSRVTSQSEKPSWHLVPQLVYGIPAVLLLAIAIFWGINGTADEINPEEMLAEVSTEDLVLYLEDSDITTEEIIETVDFESMDLEFEEEQTELVDEFDENELDNLMNEYNDLEDML